MQSTVLKRSEVHARFGAAPDQTIYASVADMEALSRDLAAEIAALDPPAEMIVGLANGAFLPAKIVGETLGIPWHMVKVRRKGSRYKQRLSVAVRALRIPPQWILWGPFRQIWIMIQNSTSKLEEGRDPIGFDPAGKHVVLVDDVVETGKSFRHVKAMLASANALSVRTAVYCWSVMPKVPPEEARPDVHLHRQIQFYPWSNNTTHAAEYDRWIEDNGIILWK